MREIEALRDAHFVIARRMALISGLCGDSPADIASEIHDMIAEKLSAALFAQWAIADLTIALSADATVAATAGLRHAADPKAWTSLAPLGAAAHAAHELQRKAVAGGGKILRPMYAAVRRNAARLHRRAITRHALRPSAT